MHSKEFEAALAEYYKAKCILDGKDGFGASHPSTYTDSREDVQKRLTAAKRRIIDAMAGWRPIETAPKDGTEIIVYHHIAGVCAAFCPKDGFSWHVMDGCNTIIGKKSGVSIPRLTSFVDKPTYWMPLPEPPQEKS